VDPLLQPFVEAADEAEAHHQLDILIQTHALPLARTIARRKLRPYGTQEARGGPDAVDDVVADAMTALIQRLNAARDGTGRTPVMQFAQYAAAVIHSACAHHVRRRYPERTRLKNRLRYVFSTDRRLALWMDDAEDSVCGLAAWRGRAPDPDARRRLRDLADRTDADWRAASPADLASNAAAVLTAAGGPVEFDVVVAVAAAASALVEPRQGGDPTTIAANVVAPEIHIDQQRFLARVWREVAELPTRQRQALLLNLRDAKGSGTLWLLPITGIARIADIARMLDIPLAEFSRLWRDIPLDDAAIAARLGCTRQQVINLRMSARKRLANRLTEAGGGGRANPARVSTS
jgi:RNA polymerase sigma factor (sigma-70 family)